MACCEANAFSGNSATVCCRASRAEKALALSNPSMETTEMNSAFWKRPLRGWQVLSAWALLALSLVTFIGIILSLSFEGSSESPFMFWLLAAGIAAVAAIFLLVLVRCFSVWEGFKVLFFVFG